MFVGSNHSCIDAESPVRVRWFLVRGIAIVAASVALVVTLSTGEAVAAEGAGLFVGSLATQAGSAIDESEPNDDFDVATSISLNRSIYGQLEDGSGPDYYKVNIPTSGSIKLTVSNGKHYGTGWNRFLVEIYDNYYQSIGSVENIDARYTKPVSNTFSIPRGTCYLRVEHDSWWSSVSDNHPYHFKLSYNVPPTTAETIPATRAFTVNWAKKSGAAKYQLRYSTRKNMSSSKTVNVSKGRSSKKISGLKPNKKYFVQVRVVKSIGGETYYSPWSAKKSVKTKR